MPSNLVSRHPALIPDDARLAEEDASSMKPRTGDDIPMKPNISIPLKPTSQRRRPALIPADAELTAEDARSIKLRIGDRISIAPFEGRNTDIYLAEQRAMEQEESLKEQVRTPIVRGSELNENGKRKASTSAEEYQKIIDSPRQEPSDALKSGNDTEMLDSEKDRDS